MVAVGDRVGGKGAVMGRVAAEAAKMVVGTVDSLRGERPEGVMADILGGMERAEQFVEPESRCAIAGALAAVSLAVLIVVAGRGHETFQEMAGLQLPFDDRAVVVEEWTRMMDSESGPGVGR